MKAVNAVWEQRNLGVNCYEITIEKKDSIEIVKEQLPKYLAEYVVVKVPTARTDIMFALSEMQYIFIECSIHITNNLKNIELQGVQKRLADAVNYSQMDKLDIDVLFDEIRAGMFTTDRVNLDPYFSLQQGANRYIGWISDERDRGTLVYKLTYKDKAIGFFTFKDLGSGVYFPFLAGLYKNCMQSFGLGFNIVYKPICEAIKRNGRMLSTYVSSNNLNAIHVHTMLNFKFNAIHYVYIKHFG